MTSTNATNRGAETMEIIGVDQKAKKCEHCGVAINGAVILCDGDSEVRYAMSCAAQEMETSVSVVNSQVRRMLGLKDRRINIWTH